LFISLLFVGDNLHCSPLDRAYKSKPLAHYPENVPWNPFDAHGICMVGAIVENSVSLCLGEVSFKQKVASIKFNCLHDAINSPLPRLSPYSGFSLSTLS